MADLDTAAKRRSGASWLRGLPGFGGYGPEPDGDLDSPEDRADMAGDYRGISPSGPPVVTGTNANLLILFVG